MPTSSSLASNASPPPRSTRSTSVYTAAPPGTVSADPASSMVTPYGGLHEADVDLSPAVTTVAFEKIIPPLRLPVPAGSADDPERGSFLLAFKDEDSWRKAWDECESKLTEQCEAGARMGCSVAASRKCQPPWWKVLIGRGEINATEEKRRAECEEREMMACMAHSQAVCRQHARDNCEPVFQSSPIAASLHLIPPRLLDPRTRRLLQHTPLPASLAAVPPFATSPPPAAMPPVSDCRSDSSAATNLAADGAGAGAKDNAAAATRATAAPAEVNEVAGDAMLPAAAPPATIDDGTGISPTSSPAPTVQPAAIASTLGLPASQTAQEMDTRRGDGARMSEAADVAWSSEIVQQDVHKGRGDFVRAEKSPSAWLAQQAQAEGSFSQTMMEADATLPAAADRQPEFASTTDSGPRIDLLADLELPDSVEQRTGGDVVGGGVVQHPAIALVSNVWLPADLPRHKLIDKPAVGSGTRGPPSKAAKNGGGNAGGGSGGWDGWEGGLVKPKLKKAVDTGGQEGSNPLGASGLVPANDAENGTVSESKPYAHRYTGKSKVEDLQAKVALLSQFLRGVQDAVQGSKSRLFGALLEDGPDQSRSPSQ